MRYVDTVNSLELVIFSRGAATVLGLFLFLATTISLLRTVVVPRALTSVISDAVSQTVTSICRFIAYRKKTYLGRDIVLAWNGPMIIVCQLIVWLLLYLAAYGFWIYGITGVDLLDAFRQSGSSLFTLGFATSTRADPTILEFMAAATGPIVIALLIGFLPTIYGAYVRREVNIALLGVAGGEPSWGPEYLARLTLDNQLEELPGRYRFWIEWFANVRLTHTTYPVLTQIRSPSPYRHWLVSGLCLLDAASLQLALTKSAPRAEALALLIHGTQTFETLFSHAFIKERLRNRIPFVGRYFGSSHQTRQTLATMPGYRPGNVAVAMAATADSTRRLPKKAIDLLQSGQDSGTQITRQDFDSAVNMLKEAGYPIEVDSDTAWTQFSIFRSRYEFAAFRMCEVLDAVPAPWTGPRRKQTIVIAPTSAVEILKTQLEEPLDPKRLATSPDES